MTVKTNTTLLAAFIGLCLVSTGCMPEYVEPASPSTPPSNWTAPNYNDSGLDYEGQISFESSSATDLCSLHAARIEVSGNFNRSSEVFSGEVAFSTVPGKAKATVPCSAFRFGVAQQVREKNTDRFGTVTYTWSNVSTGSGSVDASCNLTITPNLDIRGPEHRLVVTVTNAPAGASPSFITLLTVTCP